MRLRMKHRPCARCRHFFEVHALSSDPRWNGCTATVETGRCACPIYVQPATWKTRLANRLLDLIQRGI